MDLNNMYFCICAADDNGKPDPEILEMFAGTKEDMEKEFESQVINGDYPHIYMTKLLKLAIPKLEIMSVEE